MNVVCLCWIEGGLGGGGKGTDLAWARGRPPPGISTSTHVQPPTHPPTDGRPHACMHAFTYPHTSTHPSTQQHTSTHRPTQVLRYRSECKAQGPLGLLLRVKTHIKTQPTNRTHLACLGDQGVHHQAYPHPSTRPPTQHISIISTHPLTHPLTLRASGPRASTTRQASAREWKEPAGASLSSRRSWPGAAVAYVSSEISPKAFFFFLKCGCGCEGCVCEKMHFFLNGKGWEVGGGNMCE